MTTLFKTRTVLWTSLFLSLTTALKSPEISRDWLWKAPLAAGISYYYGQTFTKLVNYQMLVYPELHEQKLSHTLTKTLTLASASIGDDRPLRVLEVGVGSDCRLLRRGLYRDALEQVNRPVEFTGVDIKGPKLLVEQDARRKFQEYTSPSSTLRLLPGDLVQGLSLSSASFDAIVCCTVLCSVMDPEAAVQEIRRLLRPEGGTFGYLEHVAVEPQDHRPWFNQQQIWLDPLQQLVADNCHLHRCTGETIAQVFELEERKNQLVQAERFFVPEMWPVSLQCCGVVQAA